MRSLLKYHLYNGSPGTIFCHKVEVVIPSWRLGLALREIVKELDQKIVDSARGHLQSMVRLSPEKLEEGKKIIDRMKSEYPIREWALDAIKEEEEERSKKERDSLTKRWSIFSSHTPQKSEVIYPLKRDPKTGRMMKAERQ